MRPAVVRRSQQQGLTLIELMVFIGVISVGLLGLLSVIHFSILHSASPVLMRQQIAIAEALLAEIESKPFTFCDPHDPRVMTASSVEACTIPQTMGPSTRKIGHNLNASLNATFNHVMDYHSLKMGKGILDPITGTLIEELRHYTAQVEITPVGTPMGLTDSAAALQITVTVTAPGQADFVLTAYRFRHAPNRP